MHVSKEYSSVKFTDVNFPSIFQAAKALQKALQKLSGRQVFPTGLGDENLDKSTHSGMEALN